VPVVVMSGLEDSREEAMLAREIGAAAFLNKPVQDDILQILLEQYAAKRVPPVADRNAPE
jgi:FixJ family two-component response regulator